ncbi:MAG: thiamine-phosphate kinase [bacterium]
MSQQTPFIGPLGEVRLIERIRRILGPAVDDRVVLGIGDDAAAVKVAEDKLLLLTCDIQIENTHFRRKDLSAYQLGRRAMAVNLSDLASMGGSPAFALASLGLPPNLPLSDFDDLFAGMRDRLAEFRATIIGGNLARSTDRTIVDITLVGEVAAGKLLTRSGARPGDRIYVTGTVGSSAAGYHVLEQLGGAGKDDFAELVRAHLSPEPRVRAGLEIAGASAATSMIDLSDGLARDLLRVCESSRVGAEVSFEHLPIEPDLVRAAQELGKDPAELVLGGGEDYELLFTVSPRVSSDRIRHIASASATPMTEIGTILPPEAGCRWVDGSGRRRPLEPSGWEHFS